MKDQIETPEQKQLRQEIDLLYKFICQDKNIKNVNFFDPDNNSISYRIPGFKVEVTIKIKPVK